MYAQMCMYMYIYARDLFACSSKEQQMMIHTAIDN